MILYTLLKASGIIIIVSKYTQSNLYYEVTFRTKEKWSYKTDDLLKEFNSYQDKKNDDLLLQMTA